VYLFGFWFPFSLLYDLELRIIALLFCRIVVGSWNVAGMLPPDDIDLQEWLDTTQPADIYVIGWVVFNIFGHSVLLACFSGEVSCLLLLTLSFVLTSLVPFAKTGVENLL